MIKRTDASGAVMDSTGTPMVITFNQKGKLNLFDYGKSTESNTPSKLYVEWNDRIVDPLNIDLEWGEGKGASPMMWTGSPALLATGNITAYDGSSMITYSEQDGGHAISRFFNLIRDLFPAACGV